MRRLRRFLALGLLIGLVACGTPSEAPVVSGWSQSTSIQGKHRVLPGETLYSIAFQYGLDYRNLAKNNGISTDYHIKTGQKLQLSTQGRESVKPPTPKTNSPRTGKITQNRVKYNLARSKAKRAIKSSRVKQWLWPAKGTLTSKFSAREPGIEITGRRNSPIRAVASGTVVYSGSGLRGYGNLLIIRHNTEFLSAYAHSSKLLVKEGSVVRAGQEIAEMGSSGTNKVKLHFEIRRAGKPVDPLRYLEKGGQNV